MSMSTSFFRFLVNIFSPDSKKQKAALVAQEFAYEKTSSPRSTLICNGTSVPDGGKTSFDSQRESASPTYSCSAFELKPSAVYDGGFGARARRRGVCLRIGNGGAGQTGLIEAWANAFIQYMVQQGTEPFQVAWYLGDTSQSLAFLVAGEIDVAVTYNPAAERQVLQSGDAAKSVYAFRDHFMLVGPHFNPADLKEQDDILTMFSKIVASGDADVATPPAKRKSTRFLSRFDKSATNIKESLIFAYIGKVPWALDYSKWYHQYPRFPREALEAASQLGEYTLTDKGSWLDAAPSIRSQLRVYKIGTDDESDLLLNPAHALCAKQEHISPGNRETCKAYMKWLTAPTGGQRVVGGFKKNGQVLYSKAP